MFLTAGSIEKLNRDLIKIDWNLSKASRRFRTISILSGIGMLLSVLITFSNNSILVGMEPGILISHYDLNTIQYLTLIWYPIYVTLGIATVISISTSKIRKLAGILGTLFIVTVFIMALTRYINFLILDFTEILIGIMFISNYYTSKNGRFKVIQTSKMQNNSSTSGGMFLTDSGGYKPEFEKDKNKQESINKETSQDVSKQNLNIQNQGRIIPTDHRFDQKDSIAIIGPPGSGKTTFLAYFSYFLKEVGEALNVEVDVVNGLDLMQEYINRIFAEQKFPELTAKDRVGEVVFQFLRRKRFSSKSVYLKINDIAGETFNSLQGGPDTVRKRLMNTKFEYLLRAKGYVVMIDCSYYKEWATKDLQYRRIIETLLGARLDRKNPPKVSFLFTKTDTLPDAVSKYSAIDLLKFLKNTSTYVTKNLQNTTAFKIYIKTERDSSGEIVPKLDSGVGGMHEIRFDSDVNSGFIYITNWIVEVGEL
jgi:energy-coupling factor transporter ATP-binding protein EcfA2